jgi:hypothetical protein
MASPEANAEPQAEEAQLEEPLAEEPQVRKRQRRPRRREEEEEGLPFADSIQVSEPGEEPAPTSTVPPAVQIIEVGAEQTSASEGPRKRGWWRRLIE